MRGGWRPPPLVGASIVAHAAAAALLAARPDLWGGILAALFGNHALLGLGLRPSSQLLGPTLRRLPAANGRVALTFDDGPDPLVTPRVLDLLDRHGARATFFCIGDRAARHPELVRELHRRGHAVGNHTMHHPHDFALHGPAGQRREIEAAQAVLGAHGPTPVLFRAPLGLRNPTTDPVLHAAGLTHVSWTRRGLDTRCDDPARVLRRLCRGLAAGDILLLHDGNVARTPGGKPVVLPVLAGLLAVLAARGLRAVSLTEAWPPSPAIAVAPARAAARGSPA